LALIKNTFSTDFSTSKHVLNLGLLLGAEFINVSFGNLAMGTIGVLFSIGKALVHVLATVGHAASGLQNCDLDLLLKAAGHFLLFLKDLLNLVACVGRAIPSWLPLVIVLLCPHLSLPTMIAGYSLLLLARKLTGCFTLLGKACVVVNVKLEASAAKKVLLDPKASVEEQTQAKKAISEWESLKSQLHFNSLFGSWLFIYFLQVLFETILIVIDCHVPGFSSLALPMWQQLSLGNGISWFLPSIVTSVFGRVFKRPAPAEEIAS
jgi:hypothetical protein